MVDAGISDRADMIDVEMYIVRTDGVGLKNGKCVFIVVIIKSCQT